MGDLETVKAILSDSLTERGAYQWLFTPNRILGGEKPFDAIHEGKVREVMEAARSFEDGSYV